VTEVCVNEPGRAHVETFAGWHAVAVPELTYERCLALATAVATFGDQAISRGRAAAVDDAALGRAHPGRDPARDRARQRGDHDPQALPWPHEPAQLGAQGMFLRIPEADEVELDDPRLLQPATASCCACASRGGSGIFLPKPCATSARSSSPATLARARPPSSGRCSTKCRSEERLITIEDAKEIVLPGHANKVHLYYSQGRQGVADVTPTELLRACLRMKPDRILLGELRGPRPGIFSTCALRATRAG
jgi:type IV secretion system protein VirB11